MTTPQRAGLVHGTQVWISPFLYLTEQPSALAGEQKDGNGANPSLPSAPGRLGGFRSVIPCTFSHVLDAGSGEEPAHPCTESLSYGNEGLTTGCHLPQGQKKFWPSFSLVSSVCHYPSLRWKKEVSQTHTIRGNCIRLTLYPARSFQAWAVFISSAQKTEERCL